MFNAEYMLETWVQRKKKKNTQQSIQSGISKEQRKASLKRWAGPSIMWREDFLFWCCVKTAGNRMDRFLHWELQGQGTAPQMFLLRTSH